MKNELKTFTNDTFGSIRGIEINGEPWLVGKDVAEVLGYKNTRYRRISMLNKKISSSRSHHLLVSLNSKYIKHER